MYEDVELETSLNIWSVGIRGDYKILRNWYIPYFSLEMLVNYFDKIKQKTGSEHNTNDLSNALWWESVQLYSEGKRLGVGTGLGFSFDISSKFVIDIHANYSVHNLIGKKEKKNILGEKIKEEKLDSINLTVSTFYKF